jgi:hypothetical protein
MQFGGFFAGEHPAFAGQLNGGGHDFGERKRAVFLFRVDHAGDGAGNADGFESGNAGVGDDVALGVEVHAGGGCLGGALAVVDKGGLAVM